MLITNINEGLEAKDISIRMDKYGRLVVRGDKQVSEHKYMSFEETYDVPNDANLEDAHAMFEDGQIYCVTIPKLIKEQQQQHPITIQQNSHPQKSAPTSTDYLKHIRGDYSSSTNKLAALIIVIALLALLVFLIIKFHPR